MLNTERFREYRCSDCGTKNIDEGRRYQNACTNCVTSRYGIVEYPEEVDVGLDEVVVYQFDEQDIVEGLWEAELQGACDALNVLAQGYPDSCVPEVAVAELADKGIFVIWDRGESKFRIDEERMRAGWWKKKEG